VHDFEKKPAGTGDLKLSKDEKLVIRYRVAIVHGVAPTDDLKRLAP
jgi:hypothetical protein